MIITVGGSIGSGKSTLAEMIADKYSLKYYYIGDIMRQLAKEKGISLMKLSLLAENDPTIDRELDEKQKEIARAGECVIDSRLGAYFLEADFKIWLDVSLDVQAERIAKRDDLTIDEAKMHIARREASETERYRKIYDINIHDQSVYDLVLDTSDLTKPQMLEKSAEAIENKRG